MKRWSAWIESLAIFGVASLAAAQVPVLGSIEAPYAAVQSQVQMAGNTYGPGTVAYGPTGTPLVLSGSGLGDNGDVWFFAYKNGALDIKTAPTQAIVTLWTANQIFLKVPSGAVSGLVQVVTGDRTSNPLPFIVTAGTYSGSCPTGPSPSQLQITTDSLQDGAANRSYSVQLNATGGSSSYAWSLVSGSLPAGLSLSSSGVISGTPTSASSPVSFTVQVVDTSSPQQHDEATLSLEVATEPESGSSAAPYSFSIQVTGGGAEGYDAVGNVTAYTDSVNGTWSLAYDTLNRLSTANGSQDENPYPNYCWQYDGFGNRLWQTGSPTPYSTSNGGSNSCPVTSGPSSGASYNANNQISGGLYGYDAAGNIRADSTTGNSYLYDGEGRICAMQQSIDGTTTMTQYLYDGEGHRVAKGTISSFSCDTTSNNFVATAFYVLGPSGGQMTEMTNNSGTWLWAHTNVDAAGMSATYDADPSGQTAGPLNFHLTDWLGTRRQQTDYAGNPVLNFTGLPYGDSLVPVPVSTSDVADATEHHFTGKEHDSESGNDYFGARYYASSMGRFSSPDPGWFFATHPENPQSWNLYSYVLNNPLSFVDPFGYDCVYLNDAGTDVDRDANGNPTGIDQNSNKGECEGQHGKWVDGTVTQIYLDPNSNAVALNGQLDNGTGTKSFYPDDSGTSVTVNAGSPDPIATIPPGAMGYIQNVGPGGVPALAGFDPWPTRLFGTHWCGPGGGGVPVNALDAACKAHDACYGAAGISAANNTGGQAMSLGQAAAASACNQALYNAARAHPFIYGSAQVRTWLKNGDSLSILTGGMHADVLAPGTRAQ